MPCRRQTSWSSPRQTIEEASWIYALQGVSTPRNRDSRLWQMIRSCVIPPSANSVIRVPELSIFSNFCGALPGLV
jgi:hypothetical protein